MMAAVLPTQAPTSPSTPLRTGNQQTSKLKEPLTTWQLLSLVGEIGYIIAIPAALLGFLGAYLDKTMDTSPLFVIIGLALALASSTLAIWHRIKPLLNS